jgi:diacylglycerol kinase family enzyme
MPAETVHLFLNPTAGRGRAGKREPRIRELLGAGNFPLEVHLSRDAGDLEEQVRKQVDNGISRIVVAGGDGSVHEATNGIMRADGDAALGVIPTGTGNDFAKACHIPLDWEHATTLLADRIPENEQARLIDVGLMNGRYFANGAGVGLDARVTRISRSYRAPMGDLVYLLAIFRAMIDGIATPHMRITADDQIYDSAITLNAQNNDGNFDLLIVAPVSRTRIMSLLPKLIAGTHMGEKEIVHKPVTRVVIVSDEPVDSHLDGELQAMQQRFEIELLPDALRLL